MSRASEWKEKAREAAVELTLPSGAVILARRPNMTQLAEWQRLPLALASAADGGIGAALTDEQVSELMGFSRDVLIYCSVDPKIPEEIDPRDIPQEDWTFIVHWALRVEEARALDGFRRQRADAGDCGDGEAVLDKTF